MIPVTKSRFRAAMDRKGHLPVGTFVKLPATESLEMIAAAGFDFVVIDLEHSPLSLETAFQQIGVARLSGVASIVRIPTLAGGLAQRVLDAGAEGIMMPHVDSAEHAHDLVRATRFPPTGARGVGSTSRAGLWGATPREEYLRYGQEEVVVIAQIESGLAARNAAEIAAVEGIDTLFVGAADLSVEQGTNEGDPHVRDLIAQTIAAAHAVGVPVGNAGGATAASVRAAIEAGFDYTMLSNDASLLGGAAQSAVSAARSVDV